MFFCESHQCAGAGSSFRSVARLEHLLDESCGGDAEDELVPEFDDNPGTARGTKFSVLQKCSILAWSTMVFDGWPTHKYNRVLRRAFQVTELQACHRVFAP